MTTPCTGCISLADVRTELGLSGCVSLGDAAIRGLAGVPSGCIDLSDLYCKSASVPACPSPTVATLSPGTATVGTAYTGTLTITNATGGSITNLPAGLSQSGAASGLNWVITVTGTPTSTSSTALLVDATNACGGGSTTTSVTAQNAGTLVISAGAGVCPTPVINQAVDAAAPSTLTTPAWAGTGSFSQRNFANSQQPSTTITLALSGAATRTRTGTLGSGTDNGAWSSVATAAGEYEYLLAAVSLDSQSGTFSRSVSAPTSWAPLLATTTIYNQTAGGASSGLGVVITTLTIEIRKVSTPSNVISFSSGTLNNQANA